MNGMKEMRLLSKKSLRQVGNKYAVLLGISATLICFSGDYATAFAKDSGGGLSIGVAQFVGDDKDRSAQKGIVAALQADAEKNPELKDVVTISPMDAGVSGASRQEQEGSALQTGIKENRSLVIWGELTGKSFRPSVTWINANRAGSFQYDDAVSRLSETVALPVQSLEKPVQLTLFIKALTSLERGKKAQAALQLDQFIEAISKETPAGDLVFYNAFSHYAAFNTTGDITPLKRSAELFSNALKAYQEEKNWTHHADVQNNLGLILQKLASLGIDPEKNLRLSIVALQESSHFRKKNANEAGYAMTQYNLGRTYQTLATLGIEPEQNLNYAINALKEAAQIEKKQKNGVGYVYAQNNLGGSYRALAQWGVSPEKNLKSSLDALKEVAQIDKNEKNADALIAMVQKSVGMSYHGLSQWGVDPQVNLKSAIDALKNAASLEKKQANITGYIDAQNALGSSYQALAQWGNEPKQNLEQSVVAFEEAALSGKGEKNKASYAMAQDSLGMTYLALAQQGVQSEQNLNRSIAAFTETALLRKDQESVKEYAMTQNNLGMVYRELANRGIESEQNLKRSIDIFMEVSNLWKKQKTGSAGYAMAQNNLGLSYQALADRGIAPEENKKKADEAFLESREPKAMGKK